MAVIEATGVREVPQAPREVWRALAELRPYCAVCDVSYVVEDAAGTAAGTTFACVPGRVEEQATAPPSAIRGTVVEWAPPRLVATRLDLRDERWTTRLELGRAPGGGTQVTMLLQLEPTGGGALLQALQRRAAQRLVRRTLEAELDKLPAHIAQAAG